jgi:tRNA nucleotidyltransferase (CCA-adding enzyme)
MQQSDFEIINLVHQTFELELYLVGGAVRDILLGKTPKDFDFCTSATPDEIEIAIKKSGRKPYKLGKKFGTLGVKILLHDGTFEYVEITTFRTEIYKDNRKPEVVFIQDLSQDLARRDFTISAMAMNSKGFLVDLFDGQEDLQNRIIRAVGDSAIRFQEDPLRLLRAIRFAGKYGFEIEPKTFETLCDLKYKLFAISKERWVMELDAMLTCVQAKKTLSLLMDSGLLGVMLPEIGLQKNYQLAGQNLWQSTLEVIVKENSQNIEQSWACLLQNIARPFTEENNSIELSTEMIQKIGVYLKFSKARIRAILSILSGQ